MIRIAAVMAARPPPRARRRLKVTVRPAALATGGGRAFALKFGGQVIGPSWVFSERYDISATAPDNAPKEQIPRMLIERFRLTLNHETRKFADVFPRQRKGPAQTNRRSGARWRERRLGSG